MLMPLMPVARAIFMRVYAVRFDAALLLRCQRFSLIFSPMPLFSLRCCRVDAAVAVFVLLCRCSR